MGKILVARWGTGAERARRIPTHSSKVVQSVMLLCRPEFLNHAIDACLAPVAGVTIEIHSRTVTRRIPPGLS
jgi:hypothetical protein